MGQAQCSLGIYLQRAGCEVDLTRRPTAPRLRDFTEPQLGALHDVYAALGGRGPLPALRTGAWDLWVDGVLVELDEAQHFNRYRAQTLTVPWAAALPWASAYEALCLAEETACLKKAGRGGYWTSASTQRWFGDAASPGNLGSPAGSPRWKQRAFYDAVKDAVAAWSEQPVARLSVYDDVAGVPLGKALAHRGAPDLDALRDLLHRRTTFA